MIQETNDQLRQLVLAYRTTLNTVQDTLNRIGPAAAVTEELRLAGEHYDIARGIVVNFLNARGIEQAQAELWAGSLIAALMRKGMRMGG